MGNGTLSLLREVKAPIVAFSGGKDSLLALHMAREVRPDIGVIIFLDWYTKESLEWIKECIVSLELTAFFYRPTVLKYKDGSIVSHYPFGDSAIPVITDVEFDNACGLDKGRKILNKAPLASFLWDLVVLGSRQSDSHNLVPKLDFSGYPVCLPLWEWTDEQVWSEIKKRNIKTSPLELGDWKGCLRCLEPKGQQVYCPKVQSHIPTIGD